jgi:2-isopropylmalate synthase
LIEFSVQSVTAGIDAIGEVTIRLQYEDKIFAGYSANTDIIVASAQAYVNALNRLYTSTQQQSPLSSSDSDRLTEQTVHA